MISLIPLFPNSQWQPLQSSSKKQKTSALYFQKSSPQQQQPRPPYIGTLTANSSHWFRLQHFITALWWNEMLNRCKGECSRYLRWMISKRGELLAMKSLFIFLAFLFYIFLFVILFSIENFNAFQSNNTI